MQHAASHTTTVQHSSHNQRHVLIGKQWHQLPELIPTNSNSGLHSCISISIHTQHFTHTHTRLTALFRDYPGEPVPKGKTNLDFTEARDSEWQWNQLGHMQFCISLQTDNHTNTPPLFFTGRMPFLPPNQQRQSTEGMSLNMSLR